MGKFDLAYFGGFFDGEGCITISRQRNKCRGKGYTIYRLEVVIGSTNQWIIELIKMQFGGTIYSDRRDNHPATHRPFWRWMICSNKARAFLVEVLPYLRLKKAEAEIAIKWQDQRIDGKRTMESREKQNAIAEAQRIILTQLKRGEVN